MVKQNEHVVVLGASPKPQRYSNKAIKLLIQHGHCVTPVHPGFSEIESLNVAPALRDITSPVDTLTLYVGPERLSPMIDDIVQLKPGRVIFNPGTESAELQQALSESDIDWLEACTLVMLNTGQF